MALRDLPPSVRLTPEPLCMRLAGEEEGMEGSSGRTKDQAPQEFAEGWYANPQWSGERYWDGSQWTDRYRQPAWIHVDKLRGPFATGQAKHPFVLPDICCACGSPAGLEVLEKKNDDLGDVVGSTFVFPLCDRCAAIHSQGRPKRPGLFAKRRKPEEYERWSLRIDEWKRVDDAAKYKLDKHGHKASFLLRNRRFAEAFREANADLRAGFLT